MLGGLVNRADKLTAGDHVLLGDLRQPALLRVKAVRVVSPGFLKFELEGGGLLMVDAKVMIPSMKKEEEE